MRESAETKAITSDIDSQIAACINKELKSQTPETQKQDSTNNMGDITKLAAQIEALVNGIQRVEATLDGKVMTRIPDTLKFIPRTRRDTQDTVTTGDKIKDTKIPAPAEKPTATGTVTEATAPTGNNTLKASSASSSTTNASHGPTPSSSSAGSNLKSCNPAVIASTAFSELRECHKMLQTLLSQQKMQLEVISRFNTSGNGALCKSLHESFMELNRSLHGKFNELSVSNYKIQLHLDDVLYKMKEMKELEQEKKEKKKDFKFEVVYWSAVILTCVLIILS
jgi:hypothetical protein